MLECPRKIAYYYTGQGLGVEITSAPNGRLWIAVNGCTSHPLQTLDANEAKAFFIDRSIWTIELTWGVTGILRLRQTRDAPDTIYISWGDSDRDRVRLDGYAVVTGLYMTLTEQVRPEQLFLANRTGYAVLTKSRAEALTAALHVFEDLGDSHESLRERTKKPRCSVFDDSDTLRVEIESGLELTFISKRLPQISQWLSAVPAILSQAE